LSEIDKLWISGSTIMTFGLPLYLSSLAWQSPKVLETDKRPGMTLTGPYVTGPLGPASIILLFW